MKSPTEKGRSSDRDFDCEAAIAPEFEALVERAWKSGWLEEEVANALLSLAQERVHRSRDGAIIGCPMKRSSKLN